MAKKLECPVEDCHVSIVAETADEILEEAARHAKRDHPELEPDEEQIADLAARIKDA